MEYWISILPSFLDILTTIASLVTAAVAIWIYFYGRYQRRFDIFEQSFDVLQRINEKALESDDNAQAAILSANPNDKMAPEDARIVYFHYMRINRIFRAYEYWKGGFITKSQRNRIVFPQLKTLVSIREILPAIIERGYPEDFHEFLITEIEKVSLPKEIGPLNSNKSHNKSVQQTAEAAAD